jgi:DNA-binding MarR family transcriptional regulator
VYRLDKLPAPPSILRRLAELIEDFGGAAPELKGLTTEDKTILEALADEGRMAVNQYDLEAATKLTRRTIGPRLKHLESNGLIKRPEGTKRKGHAITAAGLSAIRRPVP